MNSMTTVIWIDWYSYHVARFRALFEHASFDRDVAGIELVGGCGVHPGLRFADSDRQDLPITSLFPASDWQQTGQLKLARAVWTKLNQLNPKAVLVPGWYTAPAIAAAAWAKLHGKRSILMSETTESDHRRVWWKEALKRVLIRSLFDDSVAGGKPHVRYLAKLGFPPARIARFYDVVDNSFYECEAARARRSPGVRDECGLPDSYFLYVGRLAPEKNVSTCIRAFAHYRRLGGSWSLVLVGDGGERNALERLADDLAVAEFVHFTGLKTTKETIPYYALASCFVLPSVREPWGLVVNEAMASGLPVLVSNRCGCTEDLVEAGGNGYVFDPSNENQLAEQMTALAALSPESLDSMKRRSQQIIANYSPENWASEIARLVK